MKKLDKGTIEKLLCDATLLEMRYVCGETEEPPFAPSEEFNERVAFILSGEYKKRTPRSPYKYILIAAVIAAILLFTAACVITLDYIINYKDNEIVVIPEPGEREHRDHIADYYTLSYVPEGYEKVEFSPTEYSAYTLWMRGEEALVFSQSAFSDGSIFGFDNDVAYTKASCGGYEIYYCVQHGYRTLYWKNDGYLFFISLVEDIEMAEIETIIERIRVVQ